MPAVEQFHPMILHFPIVLITVLAAVDLAALWLKIPLGGRDTYASVATAIAVATGGFALLAAVLGDTALDIAVSRGVSPSLFETHEGLGSLAAILFGVWAVIRAFFWWKKIPLEGGRKALVVLVDILLVLLIVLVAYYGGQLVYEHGVNVMPKAG